MLGETAFENGFYDVIIAIAAFSLIIAALDYLLTARIGEARTRYWRLPAINVIAALGLISLSAIPWAHYNVGHPISDRIYEARNLIAPEWPIYQPIGIRAYEFDPDVWSCDVGACDGDPMNTESIYRHRALGLSFRFVVYSECMSSEFNLATTRAINADMPWFDGDRRRTGRAFFDKEGRFIGPHFAWFDTPLMRSNLTEAEKQPTTLSFEVAIDRLASWHDQNHDKKRLPAWANWSVIADKIRSGEVEVIYKTQDLLLDIQLTDGSEIVGTQTQANHLDRLLERCGVKCDKIEVRN